MENKSKLPKFSGLRPPQSQHSAGKPLSGISQNQLPSHQNKTSSTFFNTHRLKRRSKSVTDMRRLADWHPPKSATIQSSTSKGDTVSKVTALKRHAEKSEDEIKPKVMKQVKIPDWDYKSRFQNLNEKHTKLQDLYKNLKLKIADFEDIDERYNALCTLQANLEKENFKLSSSNINLLAENKTLKKMNCDMKTHFNIVTCDHEELKKTHNKLVAKESEQAKELVQLRQTKNNFDELKKNHEVLVIKCEALTKENRQLKHENISLQTNLTSETENSALLKIQMSVLKQDLTACEILRRTLHNQIQDLKGNIRVFCRVRPPINDEENTRIQCNINYVDDTCIEIRKSKDSISAISGKPTDMKAEFTFDRVFQQGDTQAQFFEELSTLVQSALDGYDVCVFAYGMTGSGKTYTMQGLDNPDHRGMIPRSIDLIFDRIEHQKKTNWVYKVKASFLEIYNENVRDLLDPNATQNLEIHYNEGRGTTVTNLTIENINSANEFKHFMLVSQKNRMVASTNFNEHSSRSHAVTKIYLHGSNEEVNCHYSGSINLVDLAGSESAKTSTKERLIETKNINKSLSTLGSVMLALYNKEKHIPYRNSKLTYLLQSCLGGHSKTLMVVNISPFEESYGESVNSMRFASKVKEVKMTIKRNKVNCSLPSAIPSFSKV